MSKVLQIWLIAAPPAVKLATIACVTEGGIRRDALGDDAMIAGEDGDQRRVDMRPAALPGRQEFGDLLEPAERAGGLGQLRLPLPRGRERLRVRRRHPFRSARISSNGRGGAVMDARE